jgi:excisionase family DNA binding protein
MAAYLTAKQVAERLQVSVSWVYKHKNLLGAVQIGERMWRFPAAQLDAHLAERLPESERPTRRPKTGSGQSWRLTY